jgi:hypothetical protein
MGKIKRKKRYCVFYHVFQNLNLNNKKIDKEKKKENEFICISRI